MRVRVRLSVIVALALTMIGGSRVAGQDVGLAQRGPRFLAVPTAGGAPVDASNAAILGRRVSLNLTRVSIETALEEIGRQAGVDVMYSRSILPRGRTVTVEARSFTVAAALTEALLGSGLDVLIAPDGQLALIRKTENPVARRAVPGAVVGRVTDAKTGDRLVGAEIGLEGTRWKVVSGENGYYRLADVEAGTYTLVVRRVGYAKRGRAVTVVAGQETTADLALDPVVTQLNEIVTTVTGEQRRLELGHVVGVINADSLVREAPISSLSELLTARVPGVQVFQAQGSVGGNVRVQIRGANSLLLGTDPIVVLDGVRYGSGRAAGYVEGGPGQAERTSPLNDLNPNDIESIEIVKGPSAATLYGTDAANGVIVIRTKRGLPGAARWNAYGKSMLSRIPRDQPDGYWAWGTLFGTPNSFCPLIYLSLDYCPSQDSITVLPNALNDPKLSLFQNSSAWQYGTNVSGGGQGIRYYFGGTFDQATGSAQMPPAIADAIAAERGVTELPEEMRKPNALSNANLRANVTAMFGDRADLQIQAGYVHGATRSLPLGFNSPYAAGVIYAKPGLPYGPYEAQPVEAFSHSSTERTDRFFGSATGQWRPTSWLAATATAGQDIGNRNRVSLSRRGDSPNSTFSRGMVVEDRARQLATTFTVGGTATARRGRVSSQTSVGVQYVRSMDDALASVGIDLPPGGSSVGEASYFNSNQTYRETVTLGSYLQEVVGLNDRLYLTGALRVDGASAFGRNYDATVYPKASVSWLVSEEPFFPRVPGLAELRLRYAFGASGQQPQPEWSHVGFAVTPVFVNGENVSAIGVSSLGNPDLKPERVREHEFGFDANGLAGRVQLGLTWYQRRTVGQIIPASLPLGLGTIYTNLGLTTQHGFEVELTTHVLDGPRLSWDIMFQHGLHRTKLVDLGRASPVYTPQGGYVEGYALGARFMRPIVSYNDADGDGILSTEEVQVSSNAWAYMGESQPPVSQTLTSAIGLFNRRIRFSGLFERRTGFTQVDYVNRLRCRAVRCRAAVDPNTPLAEQAAAVAARSNGSFDFIETGDFTRLRELTLAVDLPRGMAHALRVRSGTLSFSGRNLALWSDFPGPDPESATGESGLPSIEGLSGGVANGVPQSRSWVLRLDLGF